MRVSVTLLQYDHGLIRQVVEVLAHVVKERNAGKHLESVKEMVGFQDRFTDALHHRKEEKFLFPAALENGSLSKDDYEQLFSDHENARRHIRAMRDQLRSADLDMFYVSAAEYVERMLHHIHHEEDVFFPKIEESLSEDQDAMIFKQFGDYLERNFPTDVYPVAESFANRVQDEILGPGYFEQAH